MGKGQKDLEQKQRSKENKVLLIKGSRFSRPFYFASKKHEY